MVEIVERKGHVGRHALQQRHDLRTERVRLAPRHYEDADAAPVADQRHRRGRADAGRGRTAAPGRRTGIVEVIVADAGFAVAERSPADPSPSGVLAIIEMLTSRSRAASSPWPAANFNR